MKKQIIEYLQNKGLTASIIKDVMCFIEQHELEKEIIKLQFMNYLIEKGLINTSDEEIKKFIDENGLQNEVTALIMGEFNAEAKEYMDSIYLTYIKTILYSQIEIKPDDYKVNTSEVLGTKPLEVNFKHKDTGEEMKGFIKTISSFEEFSDIINVFKLPPYGEPLTVIDKMEEFEDYLHGGLALACYNEEGQIMGYAGLMNEVEDEHKVYFHEDVTNLNNLYIYGLATHPEYRGFGICSQLVELINASAVPLGMDFIYLRINHKDSMSEGLCRKKGYGDLYQEGKVVFQDISDQAFRLSDQTDPEGNLKRFLIMPVTENGKEFLVATGSIPGDLDDLTSEPKKLVFE